jgi:hypothetical protein
MRGEAGHRAAGAARGAREDPPRRYPVRRRGKKVWGASWFHDGSAQGPAKTGFAILCGGQPLRRHGMGIVGLIGFWRVPAAVDVASAGTERGACQLVPGTGGVRPSSRRQDPRNDWCHQAEPFRAVPMEPNPCSAGGASGGCVGAAGGCSCCCPGGLVMVRVSGLRLVREFARECVVAVSRGWALAFRNARHAGRRLVRGSG